MALAVLDGNQSATTLSSVVTGGEHIVAHSVVSLGSAAISNITSAVSGSVVSVSNFPASTTVTGQVELGPTSLNALESITVTMGQVTVTGGLTDTQLRASAVTASVSNFPATQTIAGTVTVGNSVTIGSLPAISGTVTANLFAEHVGAGPNEPTKLQCDSNGFLITSLHRSGNDAVNYDPVAGNVSVNVKNVSSVTISSLPAISGTVTVGNSITIGSIPAISGTVTAGAIQVWDEGNNEYSTLRGYSVGNFGSALQVIGADEDNLINGRPSLPISGTVTAAAPNGTLTTRFGTPTTASSVFATSAVTNASRKYLLIQNVTTQSNVITVGIGFTPTTTQGIQLTAGAGITFESSYIPTGAVYVLSSVTASNFTILEA